MTATAKPFRAFFPGKGEGVTVEAIVIGSLAVHRAVNSNGEEVKPKAWAISHVATGCAVTSLLPFLARDGRKPKFAYVEFAKAIQELPEFKAWAEIFDRAPWGTWRPSDLGGRAVDRSRLLAQTARSFDRIPEFI